MFTFGKYSSLAIAGTLPDERGKGVQSVLIRKRLNDAIDLGCEYMVVETAQDLPSKPSASNKNMRRFGFELAYHRPNYIFNF